MPQKVHVHQTTTVLSPPPIALAAADSIPAAASVVAAGAVRLQEEVAVVRKVAVQRKVVGLKVAGLPVAVAAV